MQPILIRGYRFPMSDTGYMEVTLNKNGEIEIATYYSSGTLDDSQSFTVEDAANMAEALSLIIHGPAETPPAETTQPAEEAIPNE